MPSPRRPEPARLSLIPMKPISARQKRRLLAHLAHLRAEGRVLDSVDSVDAQVAKLTGLYPRAAVRILPERVSFVRSWGGAPSVRVIPARACLARPRFILNEPAIATLTVQEFTVSGGGSTSWPMWCMSSGTWHDDHEKLYWRSRGVGRNTPHGRIPGLVSPCDGWTLERPVVGAAFADERNRRFIVTALRGGEHRLIEIRGETDSTYRALNIVKATISSCRSRPRGALSYLGCVSPETVKKLVALTDTGESYGTGDYHAG